MDNSAIQMIVLRLQRLSSLLEVLMAASVSHTATSGESMKCVLLDATNTADELAQELEQLASR